MVGHVPAGHITLRTSRLSADFGAKVAGEVPLPDNPLPMLGVMFRDASPRPLSETPKVRWDFGDGQTSEFHDADHVYLHPGIYTVKLTIQHIGRNFEITNRIAVYPPWQTQPGKSHTLDEYLKVVSGYAPEKLDALGLRQLAAAYEAKAASFENKAAARQRAIEENEKRMTERARAASRAKREADEAADPAKRYLGEAVAVVRKALASDSQTLTGDSELMNLAKSIGPLARDALGDSQSAAWIWQGVGRRVKSPVLRAACEAEMADIAVNDSLNFKAAKSLVQSAVAALGTVKKGPVAARVEQVRGDLAASTGDGKAAREAYLAAQRCLDADGSYARQTARRGAYGRSTEEFLKDKQLDRAAQEIRTWQRDFPADRLDGYQTLLYARYWADRKQFAQAIGQADQLLAVSPDSPYIDQLLYLAAQCELKRNQRDRAVAVLHSIEKDYPGSPLIPQVKQALRALEKDEKK